ncbi:Lrp/AsnC family transcriptional regulator [Infirmifilum lucidum]|uniref:Lrp/AsnC family transcriptional regulator n=1 Tax=Infirmifilum lucidum TaxID=2776706 RepID=A0A7L9FI99_9CREN|nr:Lrp/AsnC family transcriptional regulator [Infirmifilum lucidum]QOJ79479.1 Lrp/AsnC family transcriptional regulator [Infirmifilum lucidum]
MSEKITVYILVNTQVGKEDEVLKSIRGMGFVEEAHIVYGEYDIIAKLSIPALELLDQTVTNIRKMPGVTKTSTLITSSR